MTACVFVSVLSELKLLAFVMLCIIPRICVWDHMRERFSVIAVQ